MNFIVAFCLSLFQNINRVFSIIVKNFRILLRSKSSALIVVFGPLIVISLIVVAFNNSTIFDIQVATYSRSYSPLAEDLLQQMRDEQYSITKVDSLDVCIEGVKKGDHNLCLLFSPELSIQGAENNKITFYVDYTRVNLVYAVMDNLADKLSKKSDQLSLELAEILVNELQNAKVEVAGKLSSLNAITANAGTVNDKVGAVTVNLNALDLDIDIGALDLEGIHTDLKGIEEELGPENETVESLQSLEEKIESLETNVQTSYAKIPIAKTNIANAVNELNAVKAVLTNDKASLEQIRDSLSRVTKSIESINVTDPSQVATPISTSIQPVVTQVTHLSKLFPTFLTIIIMFVCIMLASTLVINEKTTNAYFRNFISPTHDGIFLLGTYVTCLLIISFQLAIILIVSRFFLDAESLAALSNIYVPLFLVVTLFILLGLALGYVFNSQETAILAALFFVSGCLLFSNTILPLESIPNTLKEWFLLNPFVLSEDLLRKVILFAFNNGQLMTYFKILSIYIGVVLVLSYFALKFYKRKMRG